MATTRGGKGSSCPNGASKAQLLAGPTQPKHQSNHITTGLAKQPCHRPQKTTITISDTTTSSGDGSAQSPSSGHDTSQVSSHTEPRTAHPEPAAAQPEPGVASSSPPTTPPTRMLDSIPALLTDEDRVIQGKFYGFGGKVALAQTCRSC